MTETSNTTHKRTNLRKAVCLLAAVGLLGVLPFVVTWQPVNVSAGDEDSAKNTSATDRKTAEEVKPSSSTPSQTEKSESSGKPGTGPPPAPVRVGTVDKRELMARWQVLGRLRQVRRTTVGVGQQGRVIEVPVEEGDRVTGGKTLLAKIDQTFAKIELASAEAQLGQRRAAVDQAASKVVESKAEVKEAAAELEKAQRDFDRSKFLFEQRSADRKEYDDARSDRDARAARLDVVKAAVTSMQASLVTAQKLVLVAEAEKQRVLETIKRFSVMTPGNGEWIVVRKTMEVGQWVQKGAPVVDLVSVGTIDAVVDVPERFINTIQVGDEVSVTVNALKKSAMGKVVAVIPVGADAARSFPVKVRLDDQKGKFKSGMSVTALVPVSKKQSVLTVPRDAVLFSARGSVVWAVVDGKAMPIAVEVLFSEGGRYAVRQAVASQKPEIASGMAVVIEGGERLLFPGQPLTIVKPASSKDAAPNAGKSDAAGPAKKAG